MTTNISGEQTGYEPSIIGTPNLLFGNDVYFSPPLRFQEDLDKAISKAVKINRKEKDFFHYRYEYDDGSRPTAKEIKRRIVEYYTSEHHRTLYGQRFRGRDLPAEIYSQFDEVTDEDDKLILDQARLSLLFTDLISTQCWANAFHIAGIAYERTPEDDPARDFYHAVAAFCGGIIAHEFARMALGYADGRLATEYTPRLKHLVTVCWPYIEDLEKFAPEEAAVKKQLLRELLLEHIAQTGRNDDSDNFIRLVAGVHWQDEAGAEETITKFYRMECSEQELQAIRERVEKRVEALASSRNYLLAINLLVRSVLSLGLDSKDIEQRVHELAVEAIEYMTTTSTPEQEAALIGQGYEKYKHSVNHFLAWNMASEETAIMISKIARSRGF